MRFGDREIAKEKFYAAKKPINICDVNVDNIVISKLVKTTIKKLKKKLYGPFLWMGFNCLKARATSRRQFTFYH